MKNLTLYCPAFTASQIASGLKTGKFIYDDGSLENQCRICKEYWPADTEFFYTRTKPRIGLYSVCKACYYSNQKDKTT